MANPSKGNAQMADSTGDPMIGEAQTLLADLTITYATDDPGITADDAILFTDGDGSLVKAEINIAVHEIVTKINAILDILEAHGLMKDA